MVTGNKGPEVQKENPDHAPDEGHLGDAMQQKPEAPEEVVLPPRLVQKGKKEAETNYVTKFSADHVTKVKNMIPAGAERDEQLLNEQKLALLAREIRQAQGTAGNDMEVIEDGGVEVG
jgi:hypothetical protein